MQNPEMLDFCFSKVPHQTLLLHVSPWTESGLPSPVSAETEKKSTNSTEVHVVKDFLGFLDQKILEIHSGKLT